MKNSTVSKHPVSIECSAISFDGEVLTKENILSIFKCSGWARQYPALTARISNSDSGKINRALSVFNQEFLSTKDQRKALFAFISKAEQEGKLHQLSVLLEKAMGQHQILSQVDKVLDLSLEQKKTKDFLHVLSSNNQLNIHNLDSLQNMVKAYEENRQTLNGILIEDEDSAFRKRLVALADDISGLEVKDWKYLTAMIYGEGSPFKEWAIQGVNEDVTPLLNIITNPEFVGNIRYLNKSLEQGIPCTNSANKNNFLIDVKKELKHKIESLKNDSPEVFELTILHGLTKFIAFKDFCEESKAKQGLESFHGTLKAAFSIIPSEHDFSFLRKIHNIFGSDRFVLLNFLSSKNFEKWNDLFILLKSKNLDISLVKSLYSMLSSVSDEDLKVIAQWAGEIQNPESQTSRWVSAWSDVWNQLSVEEKLNYMKLLSTLSHEDVSSASAISLMSDLMTLFPAFSSNMAEALSDENFQKDLSYLLKVLATESAEKELAHFFSENGLFEFLRIMTQQNSPKPITRSSPALVPTYVSRPSVTLTQTQTRSCFQSLSDYHELHSSYHMLVIDLPEICKKVLGEAGFVGQIYLWMNKSHQYFNETHGVTDFHARAGVWSPPMLHFIFTAAIQADFTLRSINGKGIRANVDALHRSFTHPALLETFHLFSNVLVDAVDKIPFDQRLSQYVQKLSNDDMLNWGKSFFTLMDDVSATRTEVAIRPTSCRDLNPDFGVNPCLSNTDITRGAIDILRIVVKKNEDGKSLIQELTRWLHPEGKIELPFNKKPTFTYNVNLEEVIRFAHDLSSSKTNDDFSFNDGKKVKRLTGTTFDRLEVTIREIAFKNNFYGAYFKNDVAGFNSYRSDMIKAQKLLKWLDRLGGVMRKTGALPKDSARRLDNVRNTFWSLVEVSDDYPQADGSVRSYNNLIQSLLASVAVSSPGITQDFNPYRIPKESLVEGHNGMFMTRLVELSGLRHLGRFVQSRFGDLSSLNTAQFKNINENLIGRYPLPLIQSEIQRILETYLDADRNQINLMTKDAVEFISTLNNEDQKKVESILLKFVMIMSDKNLSQNRIYEAAKGAELMIKMWPEVRELLKGINNPSKLLTLADDAMEKLLHDKSEKSLIAYFMDSKLVSLPEVESLLMNKTFISKTITLINQVLDGKFDTAGINWIETLKAIATSDNMKFDPIKAWLAHAVSPDGNNLTFTVLIKVLGEKNQDGYRLKTVMDELFLNHRSHLNQFLDETFPSLQIITE